VAVALAMGAAAIAGLVLTGMQSKAIYSKPVDELLSQKAKFAGRPVRAEGVLVHGSLVKRDQPCEYRFTIEKNGAMLPVRFAQCVVPDTFREVPEQVRDGEEEAKRRADAARPPGCRDPAALSPRRWPSGARPRSCKMTLLNRRDPL
jgi:cytochrome c-type biogenesis protein CcmE